MRPVAFSILLLLAVHAAAQAQHASYTLAEAVAQKRIELTLEAAGGHTGDALALTLRNLQRSAVRLHVPLGQLVAPSDSTAQTLVVAEAKHLALQPGDVRTLRLRTYCTEAGDASPLTGTRFDLGALAPAALIQLLGYINEHPETPSGDAQSAVWCLTSRHNPAGIGDAALKTYTCQLLGRETPPYRVRYSTETTRPGERAGWGKALIVEAQFRYVLEKDEKLDLILVDSNEKTVKVLRNDELTQAGEHRSSLRLEVYNLDPGDYTVRLQRQNGDVIKAMHVSF